MALIDMPTGIFILKALTKTRLFSIGLFIRRVVGNSQMPEKKPKALKKKYIYIK